MLYHVTMLLCFFQRPQCRQNHYSDPPGTNEAISDPKARLDFSEMDNLVQYYFEQGLSTSTHNVTMLLCFFQRPQCRQNHYSDPPGTNEAISDPKARLDFSEMDNLVQYYFEQGLSTSTHKTYKTGIKKFDEFCKKHKIIN